VSTMADFANVLIVPTLVLVQLFNQLTLTEIVLMVALIFEAIVWLELVDGIAEEQIIDGIADLVEAVGLLEKRSMETIRICVTGKAVEVNAVLM